MARRKNLIKEAERYSQFLLFEATGGAMGRAPLRSKSKDAEKDDGFKIDFQTKRALLDSMIKLASVRSKVDPEDDDEDGIESYRELLRDDGSGENLNGRTSEPPATGSSAPAIRSGANGHAASDFLE